MEVFPNPLPPPVLCVDVADGLLLKNWETEGVGVTASDGGALGAGVVVLDIPAGSSSLKGAQRIKARSCPCSAGREAEYGRQGTLVMDNRSTLSLSTAPVRSLSLSESCFSNWSYVISVCSSSEFSGRLSACAVARLSRPVFMCRCPDVQPLCFPFF